LKPLASGSWRGSAKQVQNYEEKGKGFGGIARVAQSDTEVETYVCARKEDRRAREGKGESRLLKRREVLLKARKA